MKPYETPPFRPVAPTTDEVAPYTLATWELPPCISCGGECIFTDGLCQPCWVAYTERG